MRKLQSWIFTLVGYGAVALTLLICTLTLLGPSMDVEHMHITTVAIWWCIAGIGLVALGLTIWLFGGDSPSWTSPRASTNRYPQLVDSYLAAQQAKRVETSYYLCRAPQRLIYVHSANGALDLPCAHGIYQQMLQLGCDEACVLTCQPVLGNVLAFMLESNIQVVDLFKLNKENLQK